MKIIIFNKKISKKNSLKKRKTSFLRWSLLSLTLMTGLYVFQVCEMTKESYVIHSHNSKINHIISESRANDYSFLELNSLYRVEEVIGNLGFERVSNIKYIDVSENQVAVK
jgi:acetolactate synthase regulatory subunit